MFMRLWPHHRQLAVEVAAVALAVLVAVAPNEDLVAMLVAIKLGVKRETELELKTGWIALK